MLWVGHDTSYEVIEIHHSKLNEGIDRINAGLDQIEEDICANDMAAANAIAAADEARDAASKAETVVEETNEFLENLDRSKTEAWAKIQEAAENVNTAVSGAQSTINGIVKDIEEKIKNGDFNGQDGNSFQLYGQYESYAEFIKAHPRGSIGEAYNVKEGSVYNVYFWDRINGAWANTGPLQGPKGDKGDRGDVGLQGPAGKDGQDGKVTFEDLTPEQKASLKGEKGDKGDAFKFSDFTTAQLMSIKGDKGDPGEPGRDGVVTGEIGGLPFKIMTKEQYDDLPESEIGANDIYFLTED